MRCSTRLKNTTCLATDKLGHPAHEVKKVKNKCPNEVASTGGDQ